MKKIFLGFLVTLLWTSADAQELKGYETLKPTATQQRVEQFVTQFLGSYHYKKFMLDDSLSSQVYNNLIEDIDGGHLYFTKADIKNFEKYRYQLDDALISGDLSIPYELFNKYRELYRERYLYIKERLEKPFNYESNEKLVIAEDENKPWLKSSKELDKEWDKLILNQAIGLKLAGKSDSAIVSTLQKRYEQYEGRVSKWRSEDVFQVYMNAFTDVIDPHTNYMNPSRADQFNIDMSQSLEGIGASLRNMDDYVMIMDIIPGGPLFKTQLANKEDYILAVAQGDDGEWQDIVGWLTDDAVKIIRGKKGTVVRLQLKAKDAPISSSPREVRIVREKIKLEEAVAAGEIMKVSSGTAGDSLSVGVIDIPMFYRDFEGARSGEDFQSTTRDVHTILDSLQAIGIDGVIIDLRNNGGGSLTEAIELTGLFIPEGPVVQRRTGRGKIDVEEDNDPAVEYNGPLMILQNRYSASASEIFAGAIQDYNRGLVVGEQSFGKGTVQQLVGLDRFLKSAKGASGEEERFGQLKLTTEKFYRITGNSTQRKGVIPNIELPSPWTNEENGESSRPSALEYDEIATSKFISQHEITNELVDKLKLDFDHRLKTDEELVMLLDEIKKYKDDKGAEEISLNYSERLKEKEDQDENSIVLKKLRKTKIGDERADDLMLIEAEKILSNMIVYQKRGEE